MMDFIYEENRIFLNDSNSHLIAEVTFPNVSLDTVNINHTFVDDSLRGQGIASMLIEAVAQQLRKENKKTYLTCSYAIKWFQQHEEYDNLYIK